MPEEKINICVEDRYYLVWKNWRIFSSNSEQEVKNFKENMKNSWRFYKKDIDSLIVVDILSLWKKD